MNNLYIKLGWLQYGFVTGRWTDTGTFESLQDANTILLSNVNRILDA